VSESQAEVFARELQRNGLSFEDGLRGMPDEQAEALRWDWSFWGRPEQQIPAGAWVHWLILAGRGWGKTRTGTEALRALVATNQVEHIALIGKTPADVRDVMIEGPAGILAMSPDHQRPEYISSKRRLEWPNGAHAIVYSGENPDALRGPQHQLVMVDEFAAFQYPTEMLDNIALGLRMPWRDGSSARAVWTTTPRPIAALKDLIAREGVRRTSGSTYDNAGNLDAQFLKEIRRAYEGTRLGRQELFAELLEDVAGALWSRDRIDVLRVSKRPPLERFSRIVVGVDPAATSGETSSETGIVVGGLDEEGHDQPHVYCLADRSGRMKPGAWAARAIEAMREFGADCIVAEVNNGGEMVEHTIHTTDPTVKVVVVHATRGKKVRAEPVSALYDQGRAHHVGVFSQLEDQLCSYTGARGEASPDRMDAWVWAVHALVPNGDVPVHWA
jgi:phage terminase large subunit-like protein